MWKVELTCNRMKCQGYTITLEVDRSPILGGLSDRVCPFCKGHLTLSKVEDARPPRKVERKAPRKASPFKAEQVALF